MNQNIYINYFPLMWIRHIVVAILQHCVNLQCNCRTFCTRPVQNVLQNSQAPHWSDSFTYHTKLYVHSTYAVRDWSELFAWSYIYWLQVTKSRHVSSFQYLILQVTLVINFIWPYGITCLVLQVTSFPISEMEKIAVLKMNTKRQHWLQIKNIRRICWRSVLNSVPKLWTTYENRVIDVNYLSPISLFREPVSNCFNRSVCNTEGQTYCLFSVPSTMLLLQTMVLEDAYKLNCKVLIWVGWKCMSL